MYSKEKSLFIFVVLFTLCSLLNACVNQPPVADLVAEPNRVDVNGVVLLDASDSYDSDGSGGINGIVKFEWDFDDTNNGVYDYNETPDCNEDGSFDGKTTHVYSLPGVYTVKVRVTDADNQTDTYSISVYVGKVFNVTQQTGHSLIQGAIDDANDDDLIVAYPNTYYENLDFNDVNCILTSTDINDIAVTASTIIYASDVNSAAVRFQNSADAALKGFTITKGARGIECDGSSPTINNCLIITNGNDDIDGGGLYNSNSSIPLVTNCIFWDNDANNGGAVYNDSSSPVMVNCTFSQNVADANGGGMYSEGSSSEPNITNCIFWGNDAAIDDEICNVNSADPNFIHCDVAGCGGSSSWVGSFGTDGGGNIDSNPYFVNPSSLKGIDGILGTFDDGLQIGAHGLCIDAADGDTASTWDIAGLTRVDINDIDNGGIGTPDYVDMGAYESLQIWYVNDTASAGGDGSSWSEAFRDLQTAITVANSGDQIWVAEGTYVPDSTDRDISFELPSNVTILGGFDDSSPYSRDWITNQTKLSGEINNAGLITDNSKCIVKGATGVIFDGFIIEDGYLARGVSSGMYNSYCSNMQISNCVFRDNFTLGFGGGIYNVGVSSTSISNCIFYKNKCGTGGGILNDDGSDPIIKNCVFIGNEVTDSTGGGSIANIYSSSSIVTNCILWGNDMTGGGGEVYNDATSYPVFSYCDINECGGSGEGIWDPNFGVDDGGNLEVDPCFVDDTDYDGVDNIFGTSDDGLRLDINSVCIDAGDGDFAPVADINGAERSDIPFISNTGRGNPDYTDIGVYELSYTIVDADSDGMDDNWEKKYGTMADFHSDHVWYYDFGTHDFDDDGFNDLREYLHGSDPNDDQDVPTEPVIINVPGTVAVINEAISLAIDGDTIVLAPGIYSSITIDEYPGQQDPKTFAAIEMIGNSNAKDLTIRSQNPDNPGVVNSTILKDTDGTAYYYVGCRFSSIYDDCEINISGLKFVAGPDDDRSVHYGIGGIELYNCDSTNLNIDKCVFTGGSYGEDGRAIGADNCHNININNCQFEGIRTDSWDSVSITGASEILINSCTVNDCNHGVYLHNVDSVVLKNTTIQNINNDSNNCKALEIFFDEIVLIENCTIKENRGYAALYLSGGDGYATINECVISDNNAINRDGGGIYLGCSSTIKNSIISNNDAGGHDYSNGWPYSGCDGGGIYSPSGKTVKIKSCVISNNNANGHGGGIYGYNMIIEDSSIVDNNSWNSGGGIYQIAGSGYDAGVIISNSLISGNTASGNSSGGGIYSSSPNGDSSLKITDSEISNNDAGGAGGGIYTSETETGPFVNCVIADNTAGTEGGGLRFNSPTNDYISILSCTISGNSSNTFGGGMYFASADMVLYNCELTRNQSDNGGGIYLPSTNVTLDISNSTVAYNIATGTSDSETGGIYIDNASDCFVTNSIFYGNEGINDNFYRDDNDDINFEYCNIEGSIDNSDNSWLLNPAKYVDKGGNINVDPCFVDIDSNDFSLDINSFCIDAGNPACDYSEEPSPNGSRVNMGRYGGTEFATVTTDEDGDGIFDGWELFRWPGTDPNTHSPTADEDSDDFTNKVEYLFGYDPDDEDHYPDSLKIVHSLPKTFLGAYRIKPDDSGSHSFNYYSSVDANVQISYTPTDSEDAVRTISQAATVGQMQQVTWDGYTDEDVMARSYFYDIKINATGYEFVTDNGSALNKGAYFIGGGDFDVTTDSNGFSPYKNIPLKITVDSDIYEAADFRIHRDQTNGVGSTAPLFDDLANGAPVEWKPGENIYYWYGNCMEDINSIIDPNYAGKLWEDSFYITFFTWETSGTDVIQGALDLYYFGDLILNLRCHPYRLVPVLDEVATISYDLKYPAKVTVKIIDPDGNHFVTLIEDQQQNAGSQEVVWIGENSNNKCPSKEGQYTIEVQADWFKFKGTVAVYKW